MFNKKVNLAVSLVVFLAFLLVISSGPVLASFPERDITLICPWAAGGGTDAVARVLAREAENFTDVSINVENRTGGGGAVGHGAGARAQPDGYTVTLTTVELVIQPHIEDLPFSYEDYRPVMQVNFDPAAITVPADAVWDNMDEFLAEARERPGELSTSGTGAGGIWHLATLALEAETGTEFIWVPSDGMAPAVTNLLGGHIDFVSGSPAEVASQVEAGDLKILGIFADERDPSFPDVPTLQEEGIDVDPIGAWRAIQVPVDTPDEIVEELHRIFKNAYESEGFKETMQDLGLGMVYRGPEDFSEFVESNAVEFGNLVEEFGL